MRTPSQLSSATHDMKHKLLTSCMTVKNLAFQEAPLPLSVKNGLSTRSRLYSNISKDTSRTHLDVRTSASLKKWPTPFVDCDGNYENERFLEDWIGGSLYSEQNGLPMLPVPTIESSIDKLISSASPLAESEEELNRFHEACKIFPEEVKYLQQRLEARCTEKLHTSWLSTWWNTVGYLQYREPNVINVSYFFQLKDDETLPVTDKPLSVHRGACVLTAMGEYRKLVCNGSLPVERVGKKNIPLCSVSFKYMFHSSRVPQPVQDMYRIHDPSLHKHCIVAVNGQFYSLDFVDEHDNPLPLSTLEDGLHKCMQLANLQKDWPQLGIFTSSNRDVWSENYNMLIDLGGEDMKRAMEKIESAAFMICLDHQDDFTLNERAHAYWHGNPKIMTNRWFDKTIQIIVQRNGKIGLCGEHAMSDGMPMVGLCNHIIDSNYQYLSERRNDDCPKSPVVENVFGHTMGKLISNENIMSRLDEAKHSFVKLVDEQDLVVQSFTRYGSNYIKEAGYSPDAFVQVAMQLASYRLLGKQIATYESSQTRAFLHGRTETTRSVSHASENFVKRMGFHPEGNETDALIRAEKIELLHRACYSHAKYLRDAANGLGCDRHFFGLAMLVEDGDPLPTLFRDELFIRSKTWRLSTSTLPTCPGFGPVVEDGLGIGYHVFSDRCYFTITARKKNNFTVGAMSHLIEEALLEMQRLVDLDGKSRSKL